MSKFLFVQVEIVLSFECISCLYFSAVRMEKPEAAGISYLTGIS
jgi:hypothetical protein